MEAVLFDFDGTIADTLGLAVEIAREMAAEKGLDVPDELEDASLDDLRAYEKSEILDLLPFSKLMIPFHVKEIRDRMLDRSDEIGLFDDIPAVITSLDADYTLGLLTTNSVTIAKRVLDHHGLRDYFDAVVGGIPLFGKSGQLTKLTKRLDIAAGQAVYVGDSTSDVDACRRDDIDVIGVTWGYDTRAILEEHEPSFLADAPEDILTIVRDLDCNEA